MGLKQAHLIWSWDSDLFFINPFFVSIILGLYLHIRIDMYDNDNLIWKLNLFHRATSVTSWIENVILTEFSERKSMWFMYLCFDKDWIKNNSKVWFFSFFLQFSQPIWCNNSKGEG